MKNHNHRRFYLERLEDESGVSGTGRVADGVCFLNGIAVLNWRKELSSTAVYKSMFVLEEIHGHEGKTRIVWID